MSNATRTFYLVHLEDNPCDQETFRRLFPRLSGTLLSFFRKSFSYDALERGVEGAELDICIDYHPCDSVEAFVKDMLPEPHRPSDKGRASIVFVLDYYVPLLQSGEVVELVQQDVRGVPFPVWLQNNFPQIPVLLLTIGDQNEALIPNEWKYVNKDDTENPVPFCKLFGQLASEWWQPSFWLALQEHGSTTGPLSWHTPGHNAGNAFFRSPFQRAFYEAYGPLSFQTDLSVSVPHLGDLSEPDLDSPLKDSQTRAARIFGAEDTFYITNGTSTSNKAMLMTLLRPGETILLDRNCHKSVHQAVVMSGAIPIYLPPAYNKPLGVWAPVSRNVLQNYLDADYPEDLKPRMLVLTTCTYEGVLYPIRDIADMCERNGLLFFADEAWAPYLRFHPQYLSEDGLNRYNAIDGGAHFAVQSTHKALAAFSQASMIHVSRRFRELLESKSTGEWEWLQTRFSFLGRGAYGAFRHDLLEVLRYWHSTSPHYPMLASLDCAGIQMRLEGMSLIDERIRWVRRFISEARRMAGDCVLGLDHIVGQHQLDAYPGYDKDPLKLVLGFRDISCGRHFQELLHRNHIQWEKSSDGCIEFLVTVGTSYGNLQQLLDVISKGQDLLGAPDPRALGLSDFDLLDGATQLEALPRYAATADSELVTLSDSAGRVSAQMLVPYPPGIPVFLPGLKITEEMICCVEQVISASGVHGVHGILNDGGRYYVKVLRRTPKNEGIETLRGFISSLQPGPSE